MTQSSLARRTRQPYHPPLTKQVEQEAREYIKMCEQGEHSHLFKNFEQDLLDHISNRDYYDRFGRTFIEYVVVEETLMSINRNFPPTCVLEVFACKVQFWRLRRECKALWGATPKYHALLFREQIRKAKVNSQNETAFHDFTTTKGRRPYYY